MRLSNMVHVFCQQHSRWLAGLRWGKVLRGLEVVKMQQKDDSAGHVLQISSFRFSAETEDL